jgi:hypothetical protein
MNNVAPTDAIERFAQLCALLDDGFSTREEVLAAAGLDEDRWQQLCVHWLPRLAAGDAPELALSFAPAYARARRYAGGIVLPHVSPLLGGTVVAELEGEDTDADAAPPIGLDPDRTVEGSFPLAGPAMPFRVGMSPPPAATIAPSEHPPALRGAGADATGMTLQFPSAPAPSHAVLPFCTVTGDGRVLRLERFDSRTGTLLPEPRWVDGPEPAAPPG